MTDRLPNDAPPPRLCILVKNAPTDEYGYNLHAEKGKQQFIGTVDENSPAARAGLCPGDRIYAVNGHDIVGESHRQVVQKIKSDPLKCELLVISEAGAEWYKEHNIPISMSLPNIIRCPKQETDIAADKTENSNGSPTPATWYTPKEAEKVSTTTASQPAGDIVSSMPRPRLCILKKEKPENEFGFNLHAEKDGGHFVGTVDKNSIGEKAGLCIGQRIVGVNFKLIYPSTPHREVVSLIKENPLVTELLVASEEVDRWYTSNHMEYSFQNAEVFSAVNDNDPVDESGSPIKPVEELNNGSPVTKNSTSHVEQAAKVAGEDVIQKNAEGGSTATVELKLPVPAKEEKPNSVQATNTSDKNHVASSESQNANDKKGFDIFSLTAEQARHRLHRKKDPRLDTTMTLEEKHRLISNM